MSFFSKVRFAKVNDKQMADTELVRRYVLGQLPNDAGVTAAGRRLSPTGNWVCMYALRNTVDCSR